MRRNRTPRTTASRTTASLVLATALLTTAACGSGGGSDSDDAGGAPAEPAAPVDLRMTVWTANEAHLALFNEIATAYTTANDDVKSVAFETIPLDTYTTGLTTQVAGGNPPDLAWILESAAPDFVSSGALVDLSGTLSETEGYAFDDLTPSTLELWQEDDALYAYPFSTSPFSVFYNADLFTAAGQQTPRQMIEAGTWTWENAEAAVAAIAAQSGKAGMVVRDFDFKAWDYLSTVWAGFGAQPWSEDGVTCEFTSPEMAEAFTFIHDAIFANGSMPGPGTSADFFAGESAMTVTQISRASLLEDATFAWDLVPLPEGPERQAVVMGQAGIGVFEKSENAGPAANFLAFMTNPENSAKLAQFFPPPRESLITTDVLAKSNPLLKPEQLEAVVVEGIAKGEVKPSHAGFAELQQTVRAALDPMWTPDADVEAVLADVCEAADPLLAK